MLEVICNPLCDISGYQYDRCSFLSDLIIRAKRQSENSSTEKRLKLAIIMA
jgi:hypothetical protein